jgi:hypothetical protein
MRGKALYKSIIAQTKVPTTMLNSTANRAASGLVLTTALDDGEPDAAVPERVALVAPETWLVPLIPVAVDDVVDVDTTSCTAQQPKKKLKKIR